MQKGNSDFLSPEKQLALYIHEIEDYGFKTSKQTLYEQESHAVAESRFM